MISCQVPVDFVPEIDEKRSDDGAYIGAKDHGYEKYDEYQDLDDRILDDIHSDSSVDDQKWYAQDH